MNVRKLLVAGGLVALLTTIIGNITSYRFWRRRALARVQAESNVIETALGPVEYRMSGEGPAVLIAHGSPGGYDQGFAFAKLLRCDTHTCIAVSRPGYMRTPLTSGATPEEQADLYAALLDALDIEQATIIGISGGGPSALQFALRQPQCCRGLVMISGVAQRYAELELKQALPLHRRYFKRIYDPLITSDPFLYLLLPLARLLPDKATTTDLLLSTTMYHMRKAGYENDMAQFARITSYPLERITAPTFVVHGTADDEVPFADAKLLARLVPNVKLLAIEGGRHLTFYTHAKTVMPLLREFLEKL